MKGIDTLASMLLGAYLLAVAGQGNAQKLLNQAKIDKGFLQWAAAIAILRYLYTIPELKGVTTALMTVAVVAFLIKAGTPFSQAVSKVWNSLNNQTQEAKQ